MIIQADAYSLDLHDSIVSEKEIRNIEQISIRLSTQ